jgi:Golgin subfamily A member 5
VIIVYSHKFQYHIADSGNVSAASSYYGDETAPNSQDLGQSAALPSTTTTTKAAAPTAAPMPAARPLPKATLGARSLSGGRPPLSGSAASSRKGSSNSLTTAAEVGTEVSAVAEAVKAVASTSKAPPSNPTPVATNASENVPAYTAAAALPKAAAPPTKAKKEVEAAIAALSMASAPAATAPQPLTKRGPPSIAASVDNESASVSITASVDGDDGGSAGGEENLSASAAPTSTSGTLTPAEKISRLSRLVQGLKQKVERLTNENIQLEEMLAAADDAHRGGSGEISRLEDSLAKEQAARISLEAALRGALAAKEAEVLSLKQQLDASTTRAAQLAEAVASREAEQAQFDADRSMGESQLIATLRKEIEAAESTLEEERKAHAAARRASAVREQELDSSVADAAASLTSMQRIVEERTAKAAVAEEKCRELENEVANLAQKVAAAEARAVENAENDIIITGGDNSSGNGTVSHNSLAQQRVEELEITLSELRRTLSAAETATATANEELTRLRSETEILRRQLAEARSSDSADLRRRLQEATDALYAKQAQLERATADRAATQLQLERQMSISTTTSESLKRRTAAVDRMLTGGGGIGLNNEDGYGIVPMDESTLGDTYARLVNAPGHIGHAVKSGANFIDSSTTQIVRVLRHYPLGRLAVFCYIVGMHLFIYLLLHRLQHRAFSHVTAVEAHDHLASAGGGVLLGGGVGEGVGAAVNVSE